MSIWEMYQIKQHYPKLKENKIVDILIIGGGMSGVQTLYQLKNENVCLVEAREIGSGVSKNTTAKINYLQENTLFSLWKEGKKSLAISYLASQISGMKELLDRIKQENISCDLESVTSFLVTREEKNVSLLQKFKHFLEEQHIFVTDDISSLLESFSYGIGVTDTYVFHPLKYLYGLLKSISAEVFEHTKIIKMVRGEDCYFCHTIDGYCIRAKQVVVACHYPFFLSPFWLPLKSSVEKSYLIAVPTKKNLKYTYITVENPTMSSRFYQDGKSIYQICLGANHLIGVKQNDIKNFEYVLESFHKKKQDVVFSWSNVDLETKDHLAYIGEILPHLYLCTGYQTWGMITSSLAAHMISSFIHQETSEYSFLFQPKRFNFSVLEQMVCSIGENTFSFLRSHYYPKSWYSKDLSFSFQNGKIVASYKDEEGMHSVHPICPHLKCGLIFNEVEKTWDCPCHSSRFDKDGNCLKGPSKYSIRID